MLPPHGGELEFPLHLWSGLDCLGLGYSAGDPFLRGLHRFGITLQGLNDLAVG